LSFLIRMNAVVLHQFVVQGYAIHKKLDPRDVQFAGQFTVDAFKGVGITGAVVWWNSNAEQDNRSATVSRCFDNGSDVALHDLWRKSAQTIVAAQLQDDEIGAEIFECCIDPGLAALCRFAAYAGVNDPMFVPLGIQSGLQQSRPGSVNIYAVTGTQAVAENYDSRRIRGI